MSVRIEFDQLSGLMNIWASNMEKAVTAVIREIADAGITEMVASSPADTSKLISNWGVEFGNPTGTVHESLVKGARFGAGSGFARQTVIQNARAKLRRWRGKSVVNIVNAVPYFGYVENGSPTTRPHNMVRAGVQAIVERANTIKINIENPPKE